MNMATLLPPNATPLERHLAAACARLGEIATPLRDLVNPQTCPVAHLPWLAQSLAVTVWDDAWTEAQKRNVIAASYHVHRLRGTLASLKTALAALGINAEVVEWWQETPKGEPHSFRVDVETFEGMTTNDLRSINSQIDAVKPVRSHYTVRLIARPTLQLYVGVASSHFSTTTIYPKP